MGGRCMKNGQCQCYDGFTGTDCGSRISVNTALKNGSYQVTETIKGGICYNGGEYLTTIGYCMCNVGFSGTQCQDKDTLTRSYYTAPPGSETTGGKTTWPTGQNGGKGTSGSSSSGTKGVKKPTTGGSSSGTSSGSGNSWFGSANLMSSNYGLLVALAVLLM